METTSMHNRELPWEENTEESTRIRRPFAFGIQLLWTIWILALFVSYFCYMITLPGRWEKILVFLEKVGP